MATRTPKARATPRGTSTQNELSKYGISRVSTDRFHYRDYKYNDLNDAIAQAKRDLKADKA